jgi:hypothetical protein
MGSPRRTQSPDRKGKGSDLGAGVGLSRGVVAQFGRSCVLMRTNVTSRRKRPEKIPGFLALDDPFWTLATEAEWEYFCRGGSDSLFVWGDKLPRQSELDRWLACDFTRATHMKANGFGLYCLFFGEWTGDGYKKSHAPTEKPRKGVHVVKGGAAFFWPWQDDSAWVWALPCIRTPSTDLLKDRCAAVRFVYPLA